MMRASSSCSTGGAPCFSQIHTCFGCGKDSTNQREVSEVPRTLFLKTHVNCSCSITSVGNYKHNFWVLFLYLCCFLSETGCLTFCHCMILLYFRTDSIVECSF